MNAVMSAHFLALCRSTVHSSWPSSSGVPEQDLALITAPCARRVSKVNYITQSAIKSTVAFAHTKAKERKKCFCVQNALFLIQLFYPGPEIVFQHIALVLKGSCISMRLLVCCWGVLNSR